MKTTMLTLLMLAGMLGMTTTARTQDKKDEKAMADAMAKAGAVGEHHKLLTENRAGEWKLSGEFYMDPAAPPVKTQGKSTITAILGGRYISETMTCDFLGMPYEGKGTTGYDNLKKTFVSTWIDNMGTGTMVSTGNLAADGKTLTLVGECQCPLDSSKMTMRDVWVFHSKDKLEMTMYQTQAGKETKAMHFIYERVK
jgi:hypothetical protein